MKPQRRRHGQACKRVLPVGRFYITTESYHERLRAVELLRGVLFELYYCANCDINVVVDKHGRCTVCGSDAVVRDKKIHTMNLSTTDNVAPSQHGGCNNDKAPKREES